MRKNIDVSEDCVKVLSKRAIDKGTNFKNYVEDLLEKEAKKENQEEEREGNKNHIESP